MRRGNHAGAAGLALIACYYVAGQGCMSRCRHAPVAGVALLAGLLVSACGGAKPRAAAPAQDKPRPVVARHGGGGSTARQKLRLAVLPADSDRYPRLAAALSEALATAHVVGVDDVLVTKASLEVVQ